MHARENKARALYFRAPVPKIAHTGDRPPKVLPSAPNPRAASRRRQQRERPNDHPTAIEELRQQIAPVLSTTEERQIRLKSRDFHWYSPVLVPQLKDCRADVVVQPRTEAEFVAVARAAAMSRIPLTVRGGGTGNYGQSVPIKGGILLDMTHYDKVVRVDDGSILVQGGAYIRTALDAALATGQQLMMYPSTLRIATIGGYLGGGWPGSARFAIIRDSGMIRSLKVLTVGDEPRILTLTGDEIDYVFHAWGTTGSSSRRNSLRPAD